LAPSHKNKSKKTVVTHALRPPNVVDRQVGFHQLLMAARKKHFIDGLSIALGEIDPNLVKEQLSKLVPIDVQRILAKAGLRDEHVFPIPAVLEAKPSLTGYYRLLLGASQKAFYRSETGMGIFKSMEELGTFNSKQKDRLQDFCEVMVASLADLIRRIPEMTDRDLRELPLLTFGSQLQGSHNTRIGEAAMKDVFLAIADIVDKYIIERGAKKLVVKNSTGRLVTITRSSDPDVSITESIGPQVHNKVAIEVKGGLDFSNVHNRAGEAEKSHSKAKAKQFRDFWTIISKKRIPMKKLHAESQTTTEWYDLGELLARKGTDWEDFRAKLTGAVGIPLSDSPKST
jgi:hypothetical protein